MLEQYCNFSDRQSFIDWGILRQISGRLIILFNTNIGAGCYCVCINALRGSYGWTGAGPSIFHWFCERGGKKHCSIDHDVEDESSEERLFHLYLKVTVKWVICVIMQAQLCESISFTCTFMHEFELYLKCKQTERDECLSMPYLLKISINTKCVFATFVHLNCCWWTAAWWDMTFGKSTVEHNRPVQWRRRRNVLSSQVRMCAT